MNPSTIYGPSCLYPIVSHISHRQSISTIKTTVNISMESNTIEQQTYNSFNSMRIHNPDYLPQNMFMNEVPYESYYGGYCPTQYNNTYTEVPHRSCWTSNIRSSLQYNNSILQYDNREIINPCSFIICETQPSASNQPDESSSNNDAPVYTDLDKPSPQEVPFMQPQTHADVVEREVPNRLRRFLDNIINEEKPTEQTTTHVSHAKSSKRLPRSVQVNEISSTMKRGENSITKKKLRQVIAPIVPKAKNRKSMSNTEKKERDRTNAQNYRFRMLANRRRSLVILHLMRMWLTIQQQGQSIQENIRIQLINKGYESSKKWRHDKERSMAMMKKQRKRNNQRKCDGNVEKCRSKQENEARVVSSLIYDVGECLKLGKQVDNGTFRLLNEKRPEELQLAKYKMRGFSDFPSEEDVGELETLLPYGYSKVDLKRDLKLKNKRRNKKIDN